MEPQNNDLDTSNWNVIYPTYLDKNATTCQGRRVKLEIAVEKPTVYEIKTACDKLNVPCVVEEEKRYPRNWLVPGRVRVLLKDRQSNERLKSKQQLLNEVSVLISQLKSRQPKASATSIKKKQGKKRR